MRELSPVSRATPAEKYCTGRPGQYQSQHLFGTRAIRPPRSALQWRRVPMADNQSHGLFFKWGSLQLGAAGIPALATVAFIALVFLFGRLFQAW
jgi:hypothetical protein